MLAGENEVNVSKVDQSKSDKTDILLELKEQRDVVIEKLNRFINFIKRANESDLLELESRLDHVSSIFNHFEQVQSRIESLEKCTTNSEYRETFENSFFKAQAGAKNKIVEFHSNIQARITASHNRTETGRFRATLPVREGVGDLGNSKMNAIKRFHKLESKLINDTVIRQQYSEFMREYEKLGHMTKVPTWATEVDGKGVFYLPHHGVVKDSATTKLRVVFDASAKIGNGISLNDTLMVGPTIQEDLFAIIIRFRQHNVAMVADIEKMYRQVEIVEEQRDLQRIMWRSDPNLPLEVYTLNTVTYGTAPASFIAIRCLHQLALENSKKYPVASQLFDPLGLVGSVIVKAKVIMEKLWQHKVDWDQIAPSPIISEFIHLQRELPILATIKIPRQITVPKANVIEIHTFSDASTIAYGACSYLRTVDNSGQCSVRLICAKSRVAPLKVVTLPRLELNAALLATNLTAKLMEAFTCRISNIFYYTDSTIVLWWLNTEPALLKTFVANRVADIQGKSKIENWQHVKSEHNAADIISRGSPPSQLVECDM
ncbi:uncharacterized protein LOC130899884 [Diorhabda carinulata]|uniref:uncharacterized protein LOC130899884 n=1 Tax=Diorhabda carinulata TaxID=1163345 RepID=UPI0025A2CF05|nr:uncharacterized protein LOC130899884 [Diorhabda carinulata]